MAYRLFTATMSSNADGSAHDKALRFTQDDPCMNTVLLDVSYKGAPAPTSHQIELDAADLDALAALCSHLALQLRHSAREDHEDD